MPTPRKPRSKVHNKWQPENYVKVYELARSGMADSAIALAVGYTAAGLLLAAKRDPAIRDALDRGRNGSDISRHCDFRDYVYHRLPPHLQEVWDRINLCDDSPIGYVRTKALIDQQDTAGRQHLFLYALVASGFNTSDACRKLCIPYAAVKRWLEDDPEFSELMDEIHFHKKTFFQSHLIQRVAEGDPGCTIFANRTLNADWGYRETKTKETKHSGTVNHDHKHGHLHCDVTKLSLPPEIAGKLLDAMQAELGLREGEDPVIDMVTG